MGDQSYLDADFAIKKVDEINKSSVLNDLDDII